MIAVKAWKKVLGVKVNLSSVDGSTGNWTRIVSCESVIKKRRYIYDLICAIVLPPHCFVGYFHHLSRLGNIHARQENKVRVRKGRRAFGLWSGPPGFVMLGAWICQLYLL